MKIIKVMLFLFILNVSSIFADLELVITPVIQYYSYWCWAACCEMILTSYKIANDQFDAATFSTNGQNQPAYLFGNSTSVDKTINHYATQSIYYPKGINAIPTENTSDGPGNLSKSDIATEINGGKPIIAEIVKDDGSGPYGHMVVIIGYTGSGGYNLDRVIFNDPDPTIGGKRSLTYAMFNQTGSSWGWLQTLRFSTKPRFPIPTGIGGSHIVRLSSTDCTLEINPSQNLSYKAQKYGDTPVSWEWNLIFPHSYGEATVASWTTNSSLNILTWNISNFSLPTYYDWVYTFEGKIAGRIQVECMDPDYHSDAIDVLYNPNDLYPGILYFENQVVNNTLSDVKTHEFLITQNDQFLSGANISLKSGERIDMRDGITINSGSTVNLVVDPSLR